MWNDLPASVLPDNYNPGVFKSQVNRHLMARPVTSSSSSSLSISIYRVAEFLSLYKTHKLSQDLLGLSLISILCMHAIRCLWYLLTIGGVCHYCNWDTNLNETPHDWRAIYYTSFITQADFLLIAYNYVASRFIVASLDKIGSFTIYKLQYTVLESVLFILGYSIKVLIFMPRMFQEVVLNKEHTISFQNRVQRIMNVVKRRSTNPLISKNIDRFYEVVWYRRSGTLKVPRIIYELPKYLITEINLDLFGPVFHHSPTLRRTTLSYKRWLSGKVQFEFKMPGDELYSGPLCHGNLYYIKSGIVQLLSLDDNATSILSLTDGTLFGDINFILPALHHKITTRCVTYCEIHYISRGSILHSMHKFPEDRKIILQKTKERIKHARDLYTLKESHKDLDRSDIEGIAWLKRRWWQLNVLLTDAKKYVSSSSKVKEVEMPKEEDAFHCSKYIGQVVLYNEARLYNTSIFVKTDFPWILTSDSLVSAVWKSIVKVTAFLVLISYPPILSKKNPTLDFSFIVLQFWTDFIFIGDIFISFITYCKRDKNLSFISVSLNRFKRKTIYLDILSTSLLGGFVSLIGLAEYNQICQFSPLIKIHIFLGDTEFDVRNIKTEPFIKTILLCYILIFSYTYITAFLVFLCTEYFNGLSKSYFFCKFYTFNAFNDKMTYFQILKCFWTSVPINTCHVKSNLDIYAVVSIVGIGYFMVIYINGNMVATIYFKYRQIICYQLAISNIREDFIHHDIHPNLLKRIVKYLVCQWKSLDITHDFKEEPYSIHNIIHDQVAETTIRVSKAFIGADNRLVTELAHTAKYRILPQYSTIFLLGSECDIVSWCVHGTIICEYIDKKGNIFTSVYPIGEMLSVGSVFFGDIAIRTYTASTDCEILYVTKSQFWDILKRYPHELQHIRVCQKEIAPIYKRVMAKYIFKQEQYRRRLLLNRQQSAEFLNESEHQRYRPKEILYKRIFSLMWISPESKFIRKWMALRTIVAVMSIFVLAFSGSFGAENKRSIQMLSFLLDMFIIVDIILKLFLGYFNEDGLIIYDKMMCIKHYVTRSFCIDLLGVLPWHKLVGEHFSESKNLLLLLFSKSLHLYIVNGYFNFKANKPNSNFVSIMIFKYQIIGLVLIIISTQIDVIRCFDIIWDEKFDLITITSNNSLYCWTQGGSANLNLDNYIKFYLLAVRSSVNGFVRSSSGLNTMLFANELTFTIMCITHMFYWLMYVFCIAVLVLYFRGNSLYEDGIRQLKSFLETERVEKNLIKRAVNHFTYFRFRTNGVGFQHPMKDHYGFVLKQDICYYFLKKTFAELAKQIKLSPHIRRVLSVTCDHLCFLAGEDVMREMDVVEHIYIVHRGKVVISKNGIQFDYLTKGSIFGQLCGNKLRPVKLTVRTEEPADILLIPFKKFHEIISDKTKIQLAEIAQDDFVPASKTLKENPYNSIEYLVRGNKTIKLPWMKAPRNVVNSSWYANWLLVCWLVGPAVSISISLIFLFDIDKTTKISLELCLLSLDICHFCYTLTEYLYSLHTIVIKDQCQLHSNKEDKRKRFSFTTDTITLLLPYCGIFTGKNILHLTRVYRLTYINQFKTQFCSNSQFQSEFRHFAYRITLVILGAHCICCLYVESVCEGSNPKIQQCAFRLDEAFGVDIYTWHKFYINSIGKLTSLYVGHVMDTSSVPDTTWKFFLEVLIRWSLYLVDIMLLSKTICYFYVTFRNSYKYDYYVKKLLYYLSDAGVSPDLLLRVTKYAKQLWKRQKGTWIPELALQAPQCLREDLMCSLYLHHLSIPPLFRHVPHYFLRQLAAKFHRTVIFPGKHIVMTGDIMPYVFFINEGEVEKYYMDSNGEKKIMGYLSSNGYFGVFQGIFPNTPFQCSYVSRTVVDLVYLESNDWQILLESYPKIRQTLRDSARQLGLELGIHEFFFK